MRRALLSALLLAAPAAFAQAQPATPPPAGNNAPAQAPAAPQEAQGRVTEVDDDELELELADKKKLELDVRDTTQVTWEGKPAKLKDLPKGADVRVRYVLEPDDDQRGAKDNDDDDDAVAVRIEARRAAAAPAR